MNSLSDDMSGTDNGHFKSGLLASAFFLSTFLMRGKTGDYIVMICLLLAPIGTN